MPTRVFGNHRVDQTVRRHAYRNRCLGGTDASIEIDYPMTFTRTITEQQGGRPRKFNYVHCSGVLAERDQTKSLWFMQEGRRAKVVILC